MLDYLILNGTVFDGSNVNPQSLAVGIQGERIVHVGEAPTRSSAREVIDAKDLFVCPGFIDTHASTGLGYMLPNAGDNKLYQGVTTEVIGNCGTSSAPIGELLLPTMDELAEQIGFTFQWRTLGEWFSQIEHYGLPFNIATYIGHSTLRAGACSNALAVSSREIDQMAEMLAQAMGEGSLGLSTGLVYAPGSFADTAEIITLAKAAAAHGGIYVSHIRDERQNLETSIDEAIEIGREANISVLVSHLKAAEKPNWGKIPGIIEKIENARAAGLSINYEIYPYTAVSTKLRTFIPKDTLKDGVKHLVEKLENDDWRKHSSDWLEYRETDYDAMMLITESAPGAPGMSITEVAEKTGTHPSDAVVDILINDPDAWIVYHCISQDDLDTGILWHDSIICSDSWSYPVNSPNPIGNPHPRTYGAFTRFLEQYSLGNERIPFGHAVRKITSYPAEWLGIPRRGKIAEGYFADVTILDPANVKERATFKVPRQFSQGTEYVWVNGTPMIRRGELDNNPLPGKVLKNH